MAPNTKPIFTLTPNTNGVSVAAANTASDGSGSLVTLFTAGSNGSRVNRLRWRNAQATAAASSAMVARLFVTDVNGANPMLYYEWEIEAITRTVAVKGAGGLYIFDDGLLLKSGQLLKICQSVYAGAQDLMHYFAEGGDF